MLYLSFGMRLPFIALVLAGAWLASSGDVGAQHLQARRDSLDRSWKKRADSLSALRQYRLASDSLQVLAWVDSMRSRVNTFFSDREQQLRARIDSLRGKRKKEQRVRRQLDSLEALRLGVLNKLDSGSATLQRQLTARYERWQQRLDSLTGRFSLAGVPGMPELPDLDLATPELLKLPELPALSTPDISSLQISRELEKLGVDVSLPETTRVREAVARVKAASPLPEIGKGVREVEAVVKDPGKAAEQAVANVDAVKMATEELEKAQGALTDNEAVKLAQSMKDPEALHEQAVELVKQQAMDHFAGKQEVLEQAMATMSKYKKKFPKLESLEALPKHPRLPRNGLKGKPFRERIRPGLYLAVRNTADTLLVDLFPSASYYITGSVEAGGGLIYRVREVKDSWRLDQQRPVWGFSGFGTFKIKQAVRWRLEADATSHPETSGATEDTGARNWKWAWFTGVQTNFSVTGRFTGQVQMLYSFERKLKAGFPDFLVMRVGLQYRFKAR